MMTIVAFNWPFYVAAVAVLGVSFVCLFVLDSPGLKLLSALAFAGSGYFLVGSLGVSHLVYDRSDLYRGKWLARAFPTSEARDVIFCHTGFDETSCNLQERIAAANWEILDHFDEERMTEASILRARRRYPPVPGTIAAPYSQWPSKAGAADVIFGILAIHELRSEAERGDWFSEAARCLRKDGRVILVEHVRDFVNFLAFGPGFLHFHSRASWQRAWERAGLRTCDEFRVTPWVRVFVLTKM
jgi:hypothetical protein